jgi:hypothetical protein
MRWFGLGVLAIALAGSCRQLPELEPDMCGNGVVEKGEDCDLFTEFSEIKSSCGNACRYLCDPTFAEVDAFQCPAGRACGSDGLCRQPSGEYVLAPNSPISFEASQLLISDFDGDRIADLIGGSSDRIEVRYGVGDGTHRESFSLAIDTPRGERTIGDVNGDGLQDLLAPYILGIDAFLGDRARSLIPDAHPQLELGDFLETAGALDARLLVGRVGDFATGSPFGIWTDGTNLNATFDPETGGRASVPASGDLITGVIVEDLIEGPNDELVVAIAGEPQLWLGRLDCNDNCGLGPGAGTGTIAMSAIALAQFGKLDSAPLHVADLTSDGRPDLLALARNGADTYPLVFPGRSDGFGAPAPDGRLEQCNPTDPICWPLAVATDAGEPLFVFPHVVFTSTAAQSGRPLNLNLETPWTSAVFGDFNGDGRLDVAVSDDISANVSILLRANAEAFNRIDVALLGPPRTLSAGDYDGDGVDDLAVVIPRAQEEIHVIFGEASGPPSAPIFMARFDRIARLQSTFFLAPAPWNPDRIRDIVVEVIEGQADLPKRAAILVGTARRRMHAPVPVFFEGLFAVPYFVRVGQFERELSDALDLFVLSLDGRIWMLPNVGGGRFNPDLTTLVDPAVTCGFNDPALNEGCATLEVGPIIPEAGGHSVDEVLLANRSAACKRTSALELGLLSFNGRDAMCKKLDVVRLIGDRTELTRLKLADADGDGSIDLILAVGGDSPAVVVALDKGQGGDLDNAPRVAVPMTARPLDVTVVARSQVAILTSSDLVVARLADNPADPPELRPVASGLTLGPDARLLASELDGDGLPDLIVSNQNRVYVYRGKEAFAGDLRE